MNGVKKTVIGLSMVASLFLAWGNTLLAGDVETVRVRAGEVMAVKDFVSGMPPKAFKGHKEAVISSLESAEAELWKAIAAGGASSAIRYNLTTSGGNKIGKCIAKLQDVCQELKNAEGGMQGHCLRARHDVEAAIEQLEMSQTR
jgi:hypothetical protein